MICDINKSSRMSIIETCALSLSLYTVLFFVNSEFLQFLIFESVSAKLFESGESTISIATCD
jgi:hypothetical protein